MSKQSTEEDSLPLTRLFKSPSAKVLDFLFLNREFDYSESDISKLSGVPSRTLQRVLSILKEEKLIKNTRTSSRSKMYTANLDSNMGNCLFQYVRYGVEANLDAFSEKTTFADQTQHTINQKELNSIIPS